MWQRVAGDTPALENVMWVKYKIHVQMFPFVRWIFSWSSVTPWNNVLFNMFSAIVAVTAHANYSVQLLEYSEINIIRFKV